MYTYIYIERERERYHQRGRIGEELNIPKPVVDPEDQWEAAVACDEAPATIDNDGENNTRNNAYAYT